MAASPPAAPTKNSCKAANSTTRSSAPNSSPPPTPPHEGGSEEAESTARTTEGARVKIGIIGAGNIGANAARLFVKAGHEVAISNSRGPETLSELVEEFGGGARAVTIEEAADFGEVVLEA